jgi:hypothetical protein
MKLKKPLTWNAEKKNRRIERSNGVGGNRMQAKGDSAGEWKVRQLLGDGLSADVRRVQR